MKSLFTFLLVLALAGTATAGKLVRYTLTVTDTTVSYTGKVRHAIAVNGQIPMPTLYFTEGDTAEVTVHNRMHHETSVHWHGLLLPNEEDGVSYLTTAPILPHGSHRFRFVIRQHGTYWYHSHTMLQEQSGMYGAIVIYPAGGKTGKEEVMLLGDWTDENPHQVERSLHYATDWYMIRKNAVQSYGEAIAQGHFGAKLENEWKRMHAMDVSDVYYNRFLVNGRSSDTRPAYAAGEKVRLRVINGSSSTYFWLQYSGGKMTVVASDGKATEPVEVDRFIVATSETYDVEITIPPGGGGIVTALAEDRTGTARLVLGNADTTAAARPDRLLYFEGMKMMNDMMKLNGNMNDMGMQMSLQQMDMNTVMYPEIVTPKDSGSIVTLNYGMLRSPEKTKLPEGPFRELHFELTGNMNRYVWTINNRTVSESDMIEIRKGENIRIIITNNSMMRHPMHLHGHFFRIVNRHGDYAPLKNVLDIMPMETDTIEFNASEEYGNWYFHCHILYHMMSGMGRIFTYAGSPTNPQIPDAAKALKKVYAEDRRLYAGAEIGLESNGSDGEISLMNTRWKMDAEWRVGLKKSSGYETESHIGRYFGRNQFLMAYTGWDFRNRAHESKGLNLFGQENDKDSRSVACIGLRYTLPFFIQADLRLDHTGDLRLQLLRDDIPVSPRIRAWGMVNSDLEYSAGMRYILTKYFSASAHYDSDMGWGGGLVFTY